VRGAQKRELTYPAKVEKWKRSECVECVAVRGGERFRTFRDVGGFKTTDGW
jgi:hypothetical protein